MTYWQPIRGISDAIPIRAFEGIYKPDDDGFNQKDSLFTELTNFGLTDDGALQTRSGYSVIGQFGTRVLGMGAWKDSQLHVIFNDGSWRKYNDATWTGLGTGLDTSAEWSFCNFKGNLSEINLIGANGVNPIKRYDGNNTHDLANAPAGGKYIDMQSNRLYCAVGNTVRYSALNKADDWTTVDDAGEIVYETNSGEDINGLNAGNGNVTAFKSSSIKELYGTGPSNYTFQPVAADIGITGDKAVTVNNDMLPMISRDGIYLYAGGLRPKKDFSVRVENFALGINPAQLAKCAAGTDGRYLYFAIPYGSATENNRILQYDTVHKTWATWTGIAVTHFLRIGSKLYLGDATGRVLLVGGATDNGTAITSTAITKPFTAASMARRQQWFKLWVVASISAGSTLSIYVSPTARGEDWVLTNTMTASADIQFKKILIPTNSVARSNAVRVQIVATGPVTVHEITRQFREMPMGGK